MCVRAHVRVCPAAGSFVLVMGSKNNNGKFDFKAARPKVDGLWKGKSPAGLSDDLDLNGVTELWRGWEKAPAVCSHLSSQTKKNFFVGEWEGLVQRNEYCGI